MPDKLTLGLILSAVLILAYAVMVGWKSFVLFIFRYLLPVAILAGLYWYAVRMVR
jgi:hypothetical protein